MAYDYTRPIQAVKVAYLAGATEAIQQVVNLLAAGKTLKEALTEATDALQAETDKMAKEI